MRRRQATPPGIGGVVLKRLAFEPLDERKMLAVVIAAPAECSEFQPPVEAEVWSAVDAPAGEDIVRPDEQASIEGGPADDVVALPEGVSLALVSCPVDFEDLFASPVVPAEEQSLDSGVWEGGLSTDTVISGQLVLDTRQLHDVIDPVITVCPPVPEDWGGNIADCWGDSGWWCTLPPAYDGSGLVPVDEAPVDEPLADGGQPEDWVPTDRIPQTGGVDPIPESGFGVDYLREYFGFVADNPSWPDEHGAGGIQLMVMSPSQHLPYVELGTPGEARSFDAWYEQTYLRIYLDDPVPSDEPPPVDGGIDPVITVCPPVPEDWGGEIVVCPGIPQDGAGPDATGAGAEPPAPETSDSSQPGDGELFSDGGDAPILQERNFLLLNPELRPFWRSVSMTADDGVETVAELPSDPPPPLEDTPTMVASIPPAEDPPAGHEPRVVEDVASETDAQTLFVCSDTPTRFVCPGVPGPVESPVVFDEPTTPAPFSTLGPLAPSGMETVVVSEAFAGVSDVPTPVAASSTDVSRASANASVPLLANAAWASFGLSQAGAESMGVPFLIGRRRGR